MGLLRAAPAAVIPESAPAVASNVYRSDSAVIEIPPYDYVEYKYRLAEGASMVFSWTAGVPVVQDFHGAGIRNGEEYEVSVEKATKAAAAGSLTAPFTGMHGWYWENQGGTPVTIRVTSAGFYTGAIEYRSDRTTRVHELRTGEAK
jgi:hypothetical protein